MCTGGAVCIMLMTHGVNVWVALVVAFVAGLAAGALTGLFHTAMGIPAILAGILSQLALYSINLRIMDDKANQASTRTTTPCWSPSGTCASWLRTTPSWWACSSPR